MTIHSLLACATCMGAPGHKTNIAAGNAIVVMLWLLLAMAAMFAWFVFTLARRAARHAREHGIPTAAEPRVAGELVPVPVKTTKR